VEAVELIDDDDLASRMAKTQHAELVWYRFDGLAISDAEGPSSERRSELKRVVRVVNDGLRQRENLVPAEAKEPEPEDREAKVPIRSG